MAEYAREFRTLAAEVDCNNSVLKNAFYRGLTEFLKDELTLRDEPPSLDSWINLTIKLDSRVRERRQEKKTWPSGNPRPPGTRRTRSPEPTTDEPEPMQLGHAKLSAKEKEHRREARLCLFCGESSHFLAAPGTRQKERPTSD